MAWEGVPVDEIYGLVWDGASANWTRIPLQVDERETVILETCAGLPNQDEHLSFVFTGVEGNGLDADDELVFMLRDVTGDRAPVAAAPAGAVATRYEIEVRSPDGAPAGYLYLFSSKSPLGADPMTDYVTLSFSARGPVFEDTRVETARYRLHHGARWRLDELAVLPPEGSGQDLLDRLKYRALTGDDGRGGESEETWDATSCLRGHKDGKVRALREVHGAASGVNTTYTDAYYADRIVRRVNLRVHAVGNIIFFMDFDKAVAGPSLVFYNGHNWGGVPMDGVADPSMDTASWDWGLVTHPVVGSLFFWRTEIIPFPARSRRSFWWDDARFADMTGDDEPGRFGCPGIVYEEVADTDEPGKEAVEELTLVPLAAGVGDVGAQLMAELASPLTVAVRAQLSSCGDGACDPSECGLCVSDCGSCLDLGVEDEGGPMDGGLPVEDGSPPDDRFSPGVEPFPEPLPDATPWPPDAGWELAVAESIPDGPATDCETSPDTLPPSEPSRVDGGRDVVDPNAGGAAARDNPRSEGGCSCRTARAPRSPNWAGFMGGLLALRAIGSRQRRRYATVGGAARARQRGQPRREVTTPSGPR